MKSNFLNILALATILGLVFTSCSSDDNGGGTTPTQSNELSGSITSTKTLDASVEYILSGSLIVEDGGTLTIPEGTTIKAKKGFSNYILVLQGGTININGTASKPVTLTADKDNAGAGYWGGLIINGKAKLSGDATGSTEINSAYAYGGDNDADSSGSITYLKLMYSGARSSGSVEHNGITLNGVGSGTTIENVYVYECSDDGIEFFGGSVNVKNLLVVNTDDDMFDVTQGWNGTLENAYGIWEAGFTSTEKDPRGVEADGNLDGLNPDYNRQSEFTVTNMTIDLQLAASTDNGKYMHDVLKVRRGAKATITNALVKGTGQAKDLVDLSDKKGNGNAESSINITNKLTATLSGSEINGEGNVTVSENNTGADKALFNWTGYTFK